MEIRGILLCPACPWCLLSRPLNYSVPVSWSAGSGRCPVVLRGEDASNGLQSMSRGDKPAINSPRVDYGLAETWGKQS